MSSWCIINFQLLIYQSDILVPFPNLCRLIILLWHINGIKSIIDGVQIGANLMYYEEKKWILGYNRVATVYRVVLFSFCVDAPYKKWDVE